MDEEVRDKIRRYYTAYYRDTLGIPFWQMLVEGRLSEEETEHKRLLHLQNLAGPLKGKSLLNVGCGTGGFNVCAVRLGVDAYGLDANPEAVAICHQKAQWQGMNPSRFVIGVAEKLPFGSAQFDIVYCFSVIEHVQDVAQSLREMIRVVKKDGVVHIHGPNHMGCYEGHYRIFWPPLFPKSLAKIYLRYRKRPVDYIDTINYLTFGYVERLLRTENVEVRRISHKARRNPGWLGWAVHLYMSLFNVDPYIELLVRKL